MAAGVATALRQFDGETTLQAGIPALRKAQRLWFEKSLRQRLDVIKRFRRQLATHGMELSKAISPSLQRSVSDTLSAEVIPLAEAARFLELRAQSLLRSVKLSKMGRPDWLRGVAITVYYEPHGVVLVIAPSNYPLLLPGVQVLQAVTAGNGVIWKPGVGGRAVANIVRGLLIDSGLPGDLLSITDERAESGQLCISEGVDKVVLTGSAASGRSVLAQCAVSATPATVELSGCDSFFVFPGADLDRAAKALVFGLTLNGSATCIAPRRAFIHEEVAREFQTALAEAVSGLLPIVVGEAQASKVAGLIDDAVARGARTLLPFEGIGHAGMHPVVIVDAKPSMQVMRADIFAPVVAMMTVPSKQAAVEAANVCQYALGASIFGSIDGAIDLAKQIDAGVVVINDVIVPTADPRLSFGGRKASGFGKTRGSEGLLEMTVSKSVVVQRARRLRHLETPHPRAAELFDSYLRLRHGGGLASRLRAVAGLCRAAMNRTQV